MSAALAVPAPAELLARKRDGAALDAAEIRALVRGIADASVADAQLGAFAMAVRLRDMDLQETLALTLAMRDSGSCLDWHAQGLPGPVLDKHSTGGVGDLASLVLAPLVAACGGYVPLVSGRGLGHTGGTLDKLAALPGYRADLDAATLQRVVRASGLAIAAAGPSLAPADARLYAVRDVTGTVDSVPLITASILSKKLAAGAEALVLDVKRGSGSCFADPAMAELLATRLVAVAAATGLRCSALLTDMSQPLAGVVGNALELRMAFGYLRGTTRPPRLHALVLALGAEMLLQGGLAGTADQASRRLEQALDRGDGAERLQRMLALQGAPADAVERAAEYLRPAPVCVPVLAGVGGTVQALDARALGLALLDLGGGRRTPGSVVDPRVGLADVAAIGSWVDPSRPLAMVHAADAAGAAAAVRRVRAAFSVGEGPAAAPPLLQGRLGTPA